MSFHEVRFPACLSYGAVGGPMRRTEVVTLANGHEERNTPWAHSRRRYDAGVAMSSLDDLEVVIAFFESRRGQLYGFRWKDWADHKSGLPSAEVTAADQSLGFGDGSQVSFQLTKTYTSGTSSYARPIRKPVSGSVLVAVNGAPQAEGTDFTLDSTTGVVTFVAAPGGGLAITAGYEFDVAVRFDTDQIQASVATFQAGDVPSVPVVELRV
ncbi:MAG TPA: TIGR02217 family protein [Rhodobacteraceae bacterium]|nr:TIGR02217 family protein [Paracoccaceae bacterium]